MVGLVGSIPPSPIRPLSAVAVDRVSLHQNRQDDPALPAALVDRTDPRRFRRQGRDRPIPRLRLRSGDEAQADVAHVLTRDEARRIASNIAKLPILLEKKKV